MNFKKTKSQLQNNQNLLNPLINQTLQNNSNPNPISMAKLIQENENLSLALKQEIMKNEEQENYIQSLKETIETNLYSSGFSDILASSKEYQQFQQYNKGQGKTMADFVVDFIKFKEETNNKNKNKTFNKNDIKLFNLNNKDETINKMKKDMNILQEENKNLKNKISEMQKNKNIILENNDQNVVDFEQEYKDLLIEYDRLKSQKENNINGLDTIDEINRLKTIINDRDREIQELYDNLNMLSSNEGIIDIENRKNKEEIKNCNLCIDKLQFEKKTLSDEFCNLQQKYDELINELDKSQNDYKLLNINFDKLKKEYNILLNEKNMQEKELQNHMEIKYAKDLELNDIENKFNEDMSHIQNENLKLNEQLKNAKMKINELNDNIINLKEINELTNKQLREKIENEQLILKENLNYKNAIDELNIQNEQNNINIQKEINSYKQLTKTYNTIKSENIDLQKQIDLSSQEKTKLIDANNKILEERKNFNEKYQIIINKLQNIKNIDINARTFDEFLQKISDEIILLSNEKEKLIEDIKMLNMKCFNMAQENENIIKENLELNSILTKIKNEYDNQTKEKDDLTNLLDKCKMMNYQLQKTLDDYSTELNTKINDLNNLTYDKNEIENNYIKLSNDKQVLLTILLKITKLFSLSNIYELIKDLFNKGKINNNANDINEKLVEELQRCQDYINMLKENDLETHLLNLKLNEEIQDNNPPEEKIENNEDNIEENEENKIDEEKDNLVISIDNKKYCYYCKLIINEEESIQCTDCKNFFHESCVGISRKKDDYDTNENESEEKKYICLDCLFDKKQ